MSDSTREEVVLLFNEAKNAEQRDERVQFYAQAIELVLNKEPALLEEFLPHFLEMQLDQLADVRKTLIGFLEDLIKKQPSYVPKVINSITMLSQDQTPAVLKRFVTAASATICKALLEQISSESLPLETRTQMWQVLSQLFAHFIKLTKETNTNEGVRQVLIKLLETIVLSFTLPDTGTSKTEFQKQMTRSLLPNILQLGPNHIILVRAQLQKIAENALEAIVSLLGSSSPPTTLMIALNSLAAVAKVRLTFSMAQILPALLSLSKSLASAPSTTATAVSSGSIVHTLKTVLIGFLKVKALENTEWPEKIADVLYAAPFNAREQIEQLRKHGEYLNVSAKRSAPSEEKKPTSASATSAEGENSAKRARVESATTTAPPAAPPLPSIPSPVTYPELNTIRWETVSEIVVQALMAATIPAPNQITGALDLVLQRVAALSQPTIPPPSAAPALAPAPVAKRDPRRDPRLASGRSEATATDPAGTTTEPQMPQEQVIAIYQLYHQQMAQLAALQLYHDTVVQQQQQAALLAAAAAAAQAAAAPVAMEATAPSTASADINIQPPAAPTLNLSTEMAATLERKAFLRILEGERAAHFAGKADQRALLIARLAALRPEDDSLIESLRTHLLADLPRRMDLLLDWLFEECRINDADSTTDEKKVPGSNDTLGSTRYARLVVSFLKRMLDGLNTSDSAQVALFIQLLIEIPRLPSEAITLLRQLCETPTTRDFGFHALRHLVIERPVSRPPLIQALLEYTLHRDDDLRTTAVSILARKLFAPNGERSDKKATTNPDAIVKRARKADREAHRQLKNFARQHLVSVLTGFAVQSLNALLAAAATVKQPDEERREAEDEIAAISNTEVPATASTAEVAPSPMQTETTTAKSAVAALTAQEADVNRQMHFFFELCIRDHSLLTPLAELYIKAPRDLKNFIRAKTPDLIRPLHRSTNAIIALLQNTPRGAEGFVLHMLHSYCNQQMAPPAMVATVRQQFKRVGDVRIMVPVLPALPRDEIIDLLPKLIVLPPQAVKAVIARLSSPPASAPPMPPNDLLSALHLMQQPSSSKESLQVPLKRITEATQYCLDLRNVFKQEVMAIVLQQLVDVIPLPALFMRTVIHTANKFPKLIRSGFIPNILLNLTKKQIWTNATLWEGFMRCCKQIAPFSFGAILQLPRAQLDDLLRSTADIRDELSKYIKTNSATVPKTTQQVVLDILANIAKSAAPPSAAAPEPKN